MKEDLRISEYEMVMAISEAVDLVSPEIGLHQTKTAYIAARIAEVSGYSREQINELILAGLLHDIGIISIKERLNISNFEELENIHQHAEIGYALLNTFEPLSGSAGIVRFHHVPWNNGNGHNVTGMPVPAGSYLLHLADRVSVLVTDQQNVLSAKEIISEKIYQKSGTVFMPELVDAFMTLKNEEAFWFDIVSPSIGALLSSLVVLKMIELDLNRITGLAHMFSKIIDYRSKFTLRHSTGVAIVAKALAGLNGFSEFECREMEIAGYLHDIGKLSVPKEILEKKEKLSNPEINIIRKHTYYTFYILQHIKSLGVIVDWAALHHEKIDGSGYPFKIKKDRLSLGSRIMAAADVFTAITEDRPYRKGMNLEDALSVLQKLADNKKLDSRIVLQLMENYREINSLREKVQDMLEKEYLNVMHLGKCN